jgi:hypothetical protein
VPLWLRNGLDAKVVKILEYLHDPAETTYAVLSFGWLVKDLSVLGNIGQKIYVFHRHLQFSFTTRNFALAIFVSGC